MNDNTIILITIILRTVATCVAIGGAIYLAYFGKDGWGWMIFLAIVLGSFTVRTTS